MSTLNLKKLQNDILEMQRKLDEMPRLPCGVVMHPDDMAKIPEPSTVRMPRNCFVGVPIYCPGDAVAGAPEVFYDQHLLAARLGRSPSYLGRALRYM